ncbi:hypothetical protein BDA99DRAFT_562172 [Phascolomyces articulosus]|uniref:Uncharacterized protein n=1 Tax=Phascolomyces articulosus TaxID=60185 RepID=A0AAD5K4W4_9FUNG|nr:hypothetical protein BDA99DRAFT_562172 [Phascolomyces articulosus]
MEQMPNTNSNNTMIALPPRSSRRNRRVCAAVIPYDGQQRPKLDKQYRARSYSEMMETKNISDRLALYEKTFELCMRADPQMTAWIKRVQNKGLPKAMTEGYKPRRSVSSSANSDAGSTTSISSSNSSGSSNSSSSSSSSSSSRRSFSVFLRKASASSANNNSSSRPSLPPTEPLKSSASRFIATSFSKLSSLSRQSHHHPTSSVTTTATASRSPSSLPSFSTAPTAHRRSFEKSPSSIAPTASSKIKRRLSSQPNHPRLSTSIISPPQPQIQPNIADSNTNKRIHGNSSRAIQAIPIIKPSITTTTMNSTTSYITNKNNSNYNNVKKSPAPVPSHSIFLDRLRLRRSHESMVGVNHISHHTNKFIAVRV